ncbi:TonB-dependent receptor plug domain-containing protein [Tenacibaculum ovolyticum]|uniref:TonB-dependent receptor plug domain-containing protein n=1 Tax=Tenacibaculum ovolyticum TaxID=104270 RepID=UPI0003FD718F|nr:TonB-dependent receptor [Tenacibaculum ovolyticum]
MNKKLSIILYICFVMSVFSQEKIDIIFSNTQILDVLKKTESDFKIKFSFDSNIIKQIVFSFVRKECSLDQLITEIENKTSLKFNKINSRYYFITNQKKNKGFNLLKEVLITNYVTSGINKNKNGSVSILPQQLGVLPGLTEPDVLESLKIIPGVQSPDETASGIYIRGGTPDQNLIFWDGIKMYYSGHFFGSLSAFNPYTAKKVTLSKSGTQARYGNKVSGVIDIITEENIPKKTTGGFGFNMTHADAHIRVPLSKKIALTASFRRSFTDLINSITFSKLSRRVFQTFNANQERNIITNNIYFSRDNSFYFADYSAKLIIKPNAGEILSFSFLNTKNKLSNNFIIPRYKDVYQDNLDIKNIGFSFLWKKKINKKLEHNFKFYYSNFKLNYYAEYNYRNDLFIRESTKTNSVKDIGLTYNLNYKANDRTNFLLGYDFLSNEAQYVLRYKEDDNYNNKKTNSLQQDKGTNNTRSFFAECIYDTNSWKINTGLRFNYFDKINRSVIEPRLYIEAKISNSISFKASLEQKHQTLSQIIEFQSSRLGFDLENQVWAQVNNESVPLQESFQISSGLIFNKNKWKIDIEPYLKKINGMTSKTAGYNDQTNDFSRGKGEIFGIDFLINKKIGNYRTWINYSFTKNKFKFLDLENKFFPANHDITNYFSWSHAFKFNNYEFSLGWINRTGNPYTAIHEFKINPDTGAPTIFLDTDNINANRLPKYHRLDGSVTYSFDLSNEWKGKLGFSILNIYNKKNILSRTYTAEPTLNDNNEIAYELKKIDRISLGITPNLVFRVSF